MNHRVTLFQSDEGWAVSCPDLVDSLIGTWRDDPAFDAAIRAFEQVDAEVWK